MRLIFPLAALLALAPTCASACRELSPKLQFEYAQTVVVGWVATATIPGLESLPPGSDDYTAFGKLINGDRELRIVVTQTRKGRAISRLDVKVSRCTGGYVNVGSRVIAYKSANGVWTVSHLPMDNTEQ